MNHTSLTFIPHTHSSNMLYVFNLNLSSVASNRQTRFPESKFSKVKVLLFRRLTKYLMKGASTLESLYLKNLASLLRWMLRLESDSHLKCHL